MGLKKGQTNSGSFKKYEHRSKSTESFQDGLFCDELWDISNGITLYKECHKKRHKKEGYRR